MRKHGRKDGNHAELERVLRQLGYLVFDCSGMGDGYPDLTVARGGVVRLLEVKTSEGTLTKTQQRFIQLGWPVTIVRSIDDLVAL